MQYTRRWFMSGTLASLANAATESASAKIAAPPMQYLFVDASGHAVRENLADKRRHPASLTKMMTLYTVMQMMQHHPDLLGGTAPVEIPAMVTAMRSDLYRLRDVKAGRHYTADSLAVACGTCSCAWSTMALAVHVGRILNRGNGDDAEALNAFVRQMNINADYLGMRRTSFANPVGAPDGDHFSTAKDLVRLMQALALHFPKESRRMMGQAYSAQPSIRAGALWHTSRFLRNHPNEVLFAKTGTTNAAGRCLAAAFNTAGGICYGVVIGAGPEKERNAAMTLGFDTIKTGKRDAQPALKYREAPLFSLTA